MKNLFSLLLFLCAFQLIAKGQQPCGTPLTDQMKALLLDYNAHKSDFAASNDVRSIKSLPIKFHIVGRSNGTGHYRLANIWIILCELNAKYAPTGFYFYKYGDIEYIDNDEYYDLDFYTGDDMMNTYNVPGAANVYIVNDPAGYCGYFTYGPDAVAVAKNCNAPGSTTLAHELGHYFSLPHPFDIVGSQEEYVNGANCSFAGDMFCDTRADFLDYRWSCPYTGSETDPNGDPYDPDETLFMSYSYDNCQDKFSAEQMDAMLYNLTYERANLMDHPAPDVTPITGISTLTFPIDSANDIPHDWIPFTWEPVEGADYYHLEVTRAPTFGAEPTETDVLVDGTAFTTALLPDKKYHWRVLGLKDGYTCGTWSEPETFFTVLGTGVDEISKASAFNAYPNILSVDNSLFVSLDVKKSAPSEIRFLSMNGMIAKTIRVNLITGENHWNLSTNELTAGMYLLTVLSDGKIYEEKLIVTE